MSKSCGLSFLRTPHAVIAKEHDTKKDSLEYQILEQAGKLEEFSKLIAQPKQKFLDALMMDVLPLENKKVDFVEKIVHRCIIANCKHGQD